MTVFKASIQYNEQTVRRLSSASINSFHFIRRVFFLFFCLAFIVGGAIVGIGNSIGIICIMLGCLAFPYNNNMISTNARQVIKVLNGKVIRMDYQFNQDGIYCIAGDSMTSHKYSSIVRLVEEKDFLYLFQTTERAFMVDVKSICPDEIVAYKSFIGDKVGMEWTKPFSLVNFSFNKLMQVRKNTRI